MKKIFPPLRLLLYKYKILLIIYLLLGLYVVFHLYLGQSSFFITTYIYSLAGFSLYWLCRKLKVRANLQLLLFSALLALFAAEFILRYITQYPITYSERGGNGYRSLYISPREAYLELKLMGPRKDIYTHEFGPGEVRQFNCSDYQFPAEAYNTLGLRGKLPGKNKKVTLVLGDSFTEGVGAPADSTIPVLLNNYISAHDTGSAVLNAGISGNDPFFDWKMVQKLAPQYPIKQLVFITNTTDIEDVMVRGGNERFRPNGNLRYQPAPWWERLYAVSFVFRLIMHNALKLNYFLLSPQQVEIGKQEAIIKIAALVKQQIAPWAKSHGVAVLVVLIPLKRDTGANHEDYTRFANSLKAIKGIPVLDCLPAIKANADIPNLYWSADMHFKPAGYNIISQYIIHHCFVTDTAQ